MAVSSDLTVKQRGGMGPHSRGINCPRVAQPSPPVEGAGKAGCALPPRSRVQNVHKNTHTSIQVQRKHSGLPCAMVLTVYPVLSLATGLSCHHRPRCLTRT